MNTQFEAWRTQVANARVHATTGRVVADHFGEEHPALIAHPAISFSAVLTIERRVSHDGMVSVGGNLYGVPDATRKRIVEVQNHPTEVRIFEDGTLIAVHPVLEGRNRRRLDPAHRKTPPSKSAITARPSTRANIIGVEVQSVGIGGSRDIGLCVWLHLHFCRFHAPMHPPS